MERPQQSSDCTHATHKCETQMLKADEMTFLQYHSFSLTPTHNLSSDMLLHREQAGGRAYVRAERERNGIDHQSQGIGQWTITGIEGVLR